jgi:hypothetical protein
VGVVAQQDAQPVDDGLGADQVLKCPDGSRVRGVAVIGQRRRRRGPPRHEAGHDFRQRDPADVRRQGLVEPHVLAVAHYH